MPFPSVVAASILLWRIAAQEPATPPDGTSAALNLPVSLARIREALQQPDSLLKLSEGTPDFRVDIRERRLEFLDPIDFTAGTQISPIPGARSPHGGAGGGVEVLGMLRAARRHLAEKA